MALNRFKNFDSSVPVVAPTVNRFKDFSSVPQSTPPFTPVTSPITTTTAMSTPALAKGALDKQLPQVPTTLNWKDSSGNIAGLPSLEGGAADSALGIAYNTVVGLPRAAVGVAKDIGQGIARTVGSVGITAGNAPYQASNALFGTNIPIPFEDSIDTKSNPISNAVFGGQPVKTIPKTIADTKEFLKPYIGENASSFTATPLVLGSIALDLTGFGGGKGVKVLSEVPELFFKTIAKEENPAVIKGILKGIGMDDFNASALAEPFAKTKSANEVRKLASEWKPVEQPTSPLSIERPISQPSAPVEPAPVYPPNKYPEAAAPVKSTPDTLQQTILKSKAEQDAIERSNTTAPLPEEFPVQAKEVRDAVVNSPIVDNLQNYTDISNVKKQFRDIYRNTEQVFGKDYPTIDKLVLEPLNQSKGQYIDFLNQETRALADSVPFNPGSKESKYIQLYGEGKADIAELVKEFGDAKANQIVQADSFFRSKYDEMLARLNAVEQQIYPNSPYKWTPKKAGYYRHFQEVSNDFSKLQSILENPIKIDPLLVGLSETTAPKTRWASFKQRRFGETTKNDAVAGYIDYLKSVAYATHIDPNIGRIRELADVLARGSSAKKNVNNYIYNLRKFADSLSGKTSDLDRIVTEHIPGGRTSLAAVNWLNNRVKANTILYNLKSSIAQIYNVPQGIASVGPINSAKAASKTLAQNFVENKAMKKSNFLKERYFHGFNQFDKGVLNNTRKFGAWMVGALDEVGTKFIWNGQYEMALKNGHPNPVKFADDATRKLVAGRGIGEKPLIQNSKVFQIIAPFQLEMTNLWWVMEDMAKSDKSIMKKFGQFATLFVTLYLLNSLVEKTTGTRPLLDPIQATTDGVKELVAEPNLTGVTKAGGRLFGEVLSNLPVGQTVASVYPEYGATIAGVKIPTRKEFFGRADPTRFGGGILSSQALSDPLFKILPPFGGYQLEKSLKGISTVNQGKSTTSGGSWQHPVDKTPTNYVKASLFGKYALPESRDYYKKKEAPKSTSSNLRFKKY
jgi:hypothetical protein